MPNRKGVADLSALQIGSLNYSWVELADYVANVQKQFFSQNLESGDVLLVVTAHSSFESLIVYLAALESGIIVAFVPALPHAELKKRIAILSSMACFVCPSVKDQSIELPNTLVIDCFEARDDKTPRCRQFTSSNITSLIFTSGSTGDPKAVAHTAANHLASAGGLKNEFGFDHSSTWLLSLPLFHVSGLAIVWRWLLSGCCLRIKQGKGLTLDGVTHTSMVPTQLLRVLEQNKPIELERVLLGGAIIPHQLASLAKERGVDTWAGYGLTEMASTVTAKRVDEHDTVGKVLGHRQIRVREQRIFVCGDTLAAGYWRKGILHPLLLVDGWFDTKDLGQWHNDELVILGRVDNQFISGGENVHCEEIERVLLKHPLVQQVFIVPVTDRVFGHRPVATLSLNGAKLDPYLESEFRALCQSHLQGFKHPIAYYTIPERLLGQGIKVSRAQLREWLLLARQ
ncbi:2-succinylbenzoate-CoA ligase [Vibrio inusitatus NBRC 102082]|uniref:2-succinylbenzoate-CoA ligase n=1 Tax=Vibrio inusitatus NBRC 102082 TaxID=1219070 RepID=A0A4Y3HX76_9VIBR|nr:o-succinylbenzoate--CoA ligase [Vibrio inusitatus]GEA51571.1 2-succinylbenzoate-CoA ligase [Vibrio inusitatus NBRC 102082]